MAGRGLLGRIATGSRPERNPAGDVAAIVEHLRCLLNTRRGDAVTAPDYGLESLSDLLDAFPDAANVWKKSIQETIEKYEPRLTKVRVRPLPSDNPLTICFEISARLASDQKSPVRLQTKVDRKGLIDVW